MKTTILILAILTSAVAHAQGTYELMMKAGQALDSNNYAAAAEMYTKVLEVEPNNAVAVHNRSVCYLATEQIDKALTDLTRAIELIPDDTSAYLNRGSTLAQMTEYDKAIDDFNAVLRLDSMQSQAYFMRGQVYLQKKMIPDGVADLKRLLKLEKTGERVDHSRKLLDIVGFPPDASTALAEFTDVEKNISLKLPKDWHLNVNDNGTLNMFVSLQKVVAESDIFYVGATIHRGRGMSKAFAGLKPDGASIVAFWTAKIDAAAKDYYRYKVISSKKLTVGKFVGVLREIEFQKTKDIYAVRMYDITLGANDDMVTVTLESPSVLFDEYGPVLKKAAESLKIKK